MQKERVVIIGSGPAGLSAALYAARAQLNPLLIVGPQLGGQVAITHDVENYPGFVDGVGGPEMIDIFQRQAARFGTRYAYETVTSVDFSQGSPFTIHTDANSYSADAVVITAGASPKLLDIPGEKELTGLGVSYCGTCDGFFFRGKDVTVVGGGDSAIEEGLFLTRFANKVEVIHRRDKLRAGVFLQKRAFENEKMSFIWNTVVREIRGDNGVTALLLEDTVTGEQRLHKTDGIFIFIGHYPNSNFLHGHVAMDEEGYVITDELMRASVPGIFAAGEIQDSHYRQVATSVGQGAAAGMEVEKWLSRQG
jgi:thioredoxin reductase (NADPH)